jgi:hypothetical protein
MSYPGTFNKSNFNYIFQQGSSFSSALQLRVSFGLLNNAPPFFSVLQLSSPSFHFRFMEIIIYLHLRLCRFPFHPPEADYLVSEKFSFYGVRLTSRPTPNLEDQGISLRLVPTP